MVDLHTHILPGMDDGAENVEMSLRMLREEYAQGVRVVALTPHFYCERESVERFLARREQAYRKLCDAIGALDEAQREQLPRLILGAEVAWVPGIGRMPELQKLCYEGTRCLLVEPPFVAWDDEMFAQLYELMNGAAVVPVIAHIDRYWKGQKKERLEALYAMGLPIQLSAEMLTHFTTRGAALRLLRAGCVRMIISDAHNMDGRKPNMAAAAEVLNKKGGEVEQNALHFDLGIFS